MTSAFNSTRLRGHHCWECRYFGFDIKRGIPPIEDYYGRCVGGDRSSTKAWKEVCIWGRADDERVKLSIPPEIQEEVACETSTKTEEIPEFDGLSDDDSLEALFLRCLKATTSQGVIIAKRAGIKNLSELDPLVEMGLVVRRKYSGSIRYRIPKIKKQRKKHLGY